MKVSFNINYFTVPGQRLCVLGSVSELGSDQIYMAKEMSWTGNGNWSLDVVFSTAIDSFDYRYILIESNGDRIPEPWKKRHIILDTSLNFLVLYDYWRLEPADVFFYTSAFTKNLFARKQAVQTVEYDKSIIIKIFCPRIDKDQKLAITGNQSCLGNWNPDESKTLISKDFPEWEICLNRDDITFPLEYKFFVSDSSGQLLHWEAYNNRLISYAPVAEQTNMIIHDYPYLDSQLPWKGAGTVIPVFSLRSSNSYGIGDLNDLKMFIDWAAQTNQHLVQILPMNDTTRTHTWIDSYPYSAISIYALHPIYISLSDLILKDDERKVFFEAIRIDLNKKDSVDYDAVVKYKLQYLRIYFEQEKSLFSADSSFNHFIQSNHSWLLPYAAFSYFREKYQTANFLEWGGDANYDPRRAEALCNTTDKSYDDILFTYFLQYLLHLQFKSVSDYARQKGIILKGDLPIGINPMSVEAWTERVYFNMAGQSGAPPDDFSETGQNWSFPTYNWDIMEKDGYMWWKNRFHKLSDYYDCFRIDHILGFFRIWEIPIDYTQGLCGHFRPALPFTITEIEDYGFSFDDRFLKPRIHRKYLNELFDTNSQHVIDSYLTYADADHMILKPFCDTQRKIEQLPSGELNDVFLHIKNGLLHIANEVLFLQDPYEPLKYHPRISASHSFAYKELSIEQQNAFDRLSNYFFYERHNEFWKTEAIKRLGSLISSTEMLICGEDLGMIPKTVHEVMNLFHILTLELERTPKTDGVMFSDLNTLPYMSVCTTSTHDMSPLRNWWKEDMHRTQQYYNQVLHGEGNAPSECSPEISEQIVANHLYGSSMLTVIPLQDWLGMSNTLRKTNPDQERINIPADPHHYWRYRMHISLEELIAANELNTEIKKMITNSNR